MKYLEGDHYEHLLVDVVISLHKKLLQFVQFQTVEFVSHELLITHIRKIVIIFLQVYCLLV